MKNFFSKGVSTIILLIFLLIGLTLIFSKDLSNYFIRTESQEYMVNNISSQDVKHNQSAEASFDVDKVEEISPLNVMKAKLSNKQLPVIGGIAIPSVAINLPIFKGISNEVLCWGAGTLFEEQVMGKGNYALASHRAYEPGLLFEPLDQVNIGEKFYLTDLNNIYSYKIFLKKRVNPTDVQYLRITPNKNIGTLITCGENGGITRIIVQGELDKVVSINEASSEMIKVFDMEQKTY